MKFLINFKPKRFTTKYRGINCLNCHHDLDVSDRFCPSCGQRNSTKKISLWDLIQELFSSIISYDSKLWRSMSLLFTKPGGLSLAYVNGKRNSHINPFRFFLSISVIFFLVISFFINDEDYKGFDVIGDLDKTSVEQEQSTATADSLKLNQTEKENTSASEVMKEKYLKEAFKKDTYPTFDEAVQESALEDTWTDWAMYKVYRNLSKLQVDTASFVRYMVPKVPFFIFFFIPLFTLVNALLFITSNKTYVDHLVFNYNLSSFLLIALAFLILIDNYLSSGFVGFIFWIGVYFYTYKSIRSFYGQGRFLSLLKSIMIAFFYPVFLSVFLAILIVGSFILY